MLPARWEVQQNNTINRRQNKKSETDLIRLAGSRKGLVLPLSFRQERVVVLHQPEAEAAFPHQRPWFGIAGCQLSLATMDHVAGNHADDEPKTPKEPGHLQEVLRRRVFIRLATDNRLNWTGGVTGVKSPTCSKQVSHLFASCRCISNQFKPISGTKSYKEK